MKKKKNGEKRGKEGERAELKNGIGKGKIIAKYGLHYRGFKCFFNTLQVQVSANIATRGPPPLQKKRGETEMGGGRTWLQHYSALHCRQQDVKKTKMCLTVDHDVVGHRELDPGIEACAPAREGVRNCDGSGRCIRWQGGYSTGMSTHQHGRRR